MYVEVKVSIVILVKTPEQLLHKPLRVLQGHHAAVQCHHLLPAHLAVGALSLENTEEKKAHVVFTRVIELGLMLVALPCLFQFWRIK